MRKWRSKAGFAVFLIVCGPYRLVWAQTHYSFSSDDPLPYLNAIAEAERRPQTPRGEGRIRAGVVSHHLLAGGLIAQFFRTLAEQGAPRRIVLIGPNHSHRGVASIALSSWRWKTPFGLVQPDPIALVALKQVPGAAEDQLAFSGEHSIGVPVPFIRHYLPEALVTPVLLRADTPRPRLAQLSRSLSRLLKDPGTILILSMDFSHGASLDETLRRDRRSREALLGLDRNAVRGLAVDCRPGLMVVLQVAHRLYADSVEILAHSNSAELAGKPDLTDVTSCFNVLFWGPK
jgi:AmmeMemoRadiSam system protein B